MDTKTGQLSVVVTNNIVHASLAGIITEQLILERHSRVLSLVTKTECKAVLYDISALEPPAPELIELQHKLNKEFRNIGVKLAVVVSGSRLAYRPTLTFSELNYRVFYGSVNDALQWLQPARAESLQPKKLLIADVPEAIPALSKALDQYFHLLPRTSWTGACSAVHQGIDLVLCGVGFEESKMFDLLDYLRSHHESRITPFLCIKSIRQKLPSTINDGIGIALHAKGTAGYIDFEAWQSRFGELNASSNLRKRISEALSMPKPFD